MLFSATAVFLGKQDDVLFDSDRAIFKDNVILIAIAKILVCGQYSCYHNGIANCCSGTGSDGKIVSVRSSGTILQVDPILSHDTRAKLHHLATDRNFFTSETILFSIEFSD